MAESFARRMMAQRLMTDARATPFSDSAGFGGRSTPDSLIRAIPDPVDASLVNEAADLGRVAYGGAAMGSLFLPGAGVTDVFGYAPDPFNQGEYLPSFGENIAQGNYLDAGLQTLGVAGDVLQAGGAIVPPLAAVGTALKAPRAARVAGQAADVAADAAKVDPNQAAGAAMDAAQARYFETGQFEPPTAENPVSVVLPTETEPGIIAFHGSGADFDEFRLEMIGTGEGAQAYGYGLYFTDSEDIAKFYRDTVGKRKQGMPTSIPDDPNDVAGALAQDIGFKEGVFGDTGLLQINSGDPDYDFFIKMLDDNAVETTQAGVAKTYEFNDGSVITLSDEATPVFKGKALDSVYTSDVEYMFESEIQDIIKRAQEMGMPGDRASLRSDIVTVLSQLGQGLGSKRDMYTAVESLAPSYGGPPSRYMTIYNQFIEPNTDIQTVSTLTELGSKRGKMYKVGLSPKPDELLDYDGPPSDDVKAKVLQALEGKFEPVKLPSGEYGIRYFNENVGAERNVVNVTFGTRKGAERLLNASGAEILNIAEAIAGGKKEGAALLNDAGIPGIKYFSGNSRTTAGGKLIDVSQGNDGFRAKVAVENRSIGGKGRVITTSPPYKTEQEALDWAEEATKRAERNYVVFDDKAVKILEKYGIAGPVLVTGAVVGASKAGNDNEDGGSILPDAGLL